MNLFQELADAIVKAREGLGRLPTVTSADRFENFVTDVLFPDSRYILMYRTHGDRADREMILRSFGYPSFKFCSRDMKLMFWIEAKYQPKFFGDSFILCDQWKLRQYHEINEQCPVFFALGVDGTADAPQSIYLVPFSADGHTSLDRSFLEGYRVSLNEVIDAQALLADRSVMTTTDQTTFTESR